MKVLMVLVGVGALTVAATQRAEALPCRDDEDLYGCCSRIHGEGGTGSVDYPLGGGAFETLDCSEVVSTHDEPPGECEPDIASCLPDRGDGGSGSGGGDGGYGGGPSGPGGASCSAQFNGCISEAAAGFEQCTIDSETVALQQCLTHMRYPDGTTFENPFAQIHDPWKLCIPTLTCGTSDDPTYFEDCRSAWMNGTPPGATVGPTITGVLGGSKLSIKKGPATIGGDLPTVEEGATWPGFGTLCDGQRNDAMVDCSKENEACRKK